LQDSKNTPPIGAEIAAPSLGHPHPRTGQDPFAASPREIAAFTREQMLGLVISCGPERSFTTPLPLLTAVDEHGAVTEFLGHFALSNPQVNFIRLNPRAIIVFQGPHAYIRPAWISKLGWAPTWNYLLAQFDVEITLLPDEAATAIEALVAAMEGDGPGAWGVEQVGPRYAGMVRRVIAFRARVLRASGRFKLGQDETDESFEEIVMALGDAPLAQSMRRRRDMDPR
jgi:transcriptional regulator